MFFNGEFPESAKALAAYVRETSAALAAADDAALRTGGVGLFQSLWRLPWRLGHEQIRSDAK